MKHSSIGVSEFSAPVSSGMAPTEMAVSDSKYESQSPRQVFWGLY